MHPVIGVACMRKNLLLLLAALAVAIIPGREASAVPTSPTHTEKVAFVLPWRTAASDDLAFVLPWKTAASDDLAFVVPWKTAASDEVAFVLPWKTAASDELAFVLPWKTAARDALAFVLPWKTATICGIGIGAGFEKFAMLPLGTETGRHIRRDDERSSDTDARVNQAPKPVAQVADYLGTEVAMLPLGTETGRHIRNLDEGNKQPEKTVRTSAPGATA